ncbi:DNA mismatch repair protein [Chitinophaga sp. XS-30]|uniref:MutS-related protein n=1 Tax=Chitinophaga sp. XS-30 TaxID=2604421 RepID=UPI0011DD4D5D|nr:DNA mismatch repair protein [Chitinophaga sp. XS-30]QEH40730.1 DNA mismatch repair protein [Chitinophaga sp. XS-30]
MLFTTDRQTLDDLNIFGKHGGDSIYNIFNRCATRGGAAVLEEMFRYPLSDSEAINKRSSIIQSFAALGTSFPFKSADFDLAAPYLANTDERSKLSTQENSLARKLTNMVAMDADTQLIYKGVESLVDLMKHAREFIKELSENEFYIAEKEEMRTILDNPAFAAIYQSTGKLSHVQIAEFDVVLRFRNRALVEKLLGLISYLDVYLSVAKVANERNFIFPKALPGGGKELLKLEGVYHPQVKKAVPNTIHITTDSNVIFLTGANMAGKSTFMKSLSIAMFLAHAGFPVAAKKMEFAVLDGVFTTINLPDNLGMGASHFYAEVLRVKKMAHELGTKKDLFIVFDELFRGTNVKDAYEATIAITTAFAKKRRSIFVISTHIIEAGDVLKERCPNINFVYLPTRMAGNQPEYTYTLEQGITSDRHGMVIINNERILDILRNGKKKLQKTAAYEFHNG